MCALGRGAAFGLPSSSSTLLLAQCSLRPGQLLCTPVIPGLAYHSLAWHGTLMASSFVSSVPFPPQSFVNEA